MPPTPIPSPRGGGEALGGQRRVQGPTAAQEVEAARGDQSGHLVEPFGLARDIDDEGPRGVAQRGGDGVEVKVVLALDRGGEGDDGAAAREHGADRFGGGHQMRRHGLIETQLSGDGDVRHTDRSKARRLQVGLDEGPGIALHQLVTQLELRIPGH